MKVISRFLLPSTAMLSLWSFTGSSMARAGLASEVKALSPASVSRASVSRAMWVAQAQPLPPSIAGLVLQTHSRTVNQPVDRFQIANATPQNWPDGCLGLAETGEFCAQVLVPGWEVTVTNGQQNWIYRTDSTGSAVRPALSKVAVTQPPTVPPASSTSAPTPYNPYLNPTLPSGLFPPPVSAPTPTTTPVATTQPTRQDWAVQLRWSRIQDAQEPGLVFQFDVLGKPLTHYANVVYQFYVRQTAGGRWEHLYTNTGARLIPDASAPYTLPLELLRFEEFRDKLGSPDKWVDNAQIRVSVLLRYDLPGDKNSRDLRLRFQHEESYRQITALTYNDLIIKPDGSVELPKVATPGSAQAPATPTAPVNSIPVTYPSAFPATTPPSGFPNTTPPSGFPNTTPPSGFPNTTLPSGFPNTTLPSGFPNTTLPSGFPNTTLPSGFSNTTPPPGLPPLPDTLTVPVPAIPPMGVQ